MIVKTERSQAIIDYLSTNLLINLNILGIIENVSEIDIYVDDIENPKGVFIKKDYFHYIYSKEDSFIDEVCDKFFKEGFFGFSGVEKSVAEKIERKFHVNWENPCALYYMPKENLDLSLIKNKVESIDIKDAKTVNEYYEYSYEGTLEAIKSDIKNRPSSAVYVDGEMVSWILIHDDNSLGIMHTKDEHRRKGYAVDVTIDLASKIMDNGKIPFLQIVEKNSMSPGLAKKCNFVKCGDVSWFGIIAGTPKELIEINDKSYKQFTQSFHGDERIKFFINDLDYYHMYCFSGNLNKNYKHIPDFSLEEVKNSDMMVIWCDLVCGGYDIPKADLENAKEILLSTVANNNSSYKLYIGLLNEKPVSSSALLKYDEDEEVSGLYFLSSLPEIRNQGIGNITLVHTMKKGIKEGLDLIVLQSTERYCELFKKAGFEITHSNSKKV